MLQKKGESPNKSTLFENESDKILRKNVFGVIDIKTSIW